MVQSMFLFLLCTSTPPDLVMAAYNKSVPTAVAGLMPNHNRIGVINEPPPTPVMPTIKPTIRPATTKPILPTSIATTCGLINFWPQDSDFSYNHLYQYDLTLCVLAQSVTPVSLGLVREGDGVTPLQRRVRVNQRA